jgi:hypothetical protein
MIRHAHNSSTHTGHNTKVYHIKVEKRVQWNRASGHHWVRVPVVVLRLPNIDRHHRQTHTHAQQTSETIQTYMGLLEERVKEHHMSPPGLVGAHTRQTAEIPPGVDSVKIRSARCPREKEGDTPLRISTQ